MAGPVPTDVPNSPGVDYSRPDVWRLEGARRFLHRSTRCLTEEDSTFSPGPKCFTVAEQIQHMADAVDFLIRGAFIDKKYNLNFDADITNPDAHRVKSKKEALENFDKAITWAMQLVSKMSDAELSAPIPSTPLMPPWYTLRDILLLVIDHTAHHRGALTTYSRMLGRSPNIPYYDSDSLKERV